jgi:DNA polymerase I-like protein with 3'-5' exonuclease and polymerase domains
MLLIWTKDPAARVLSAIGGRLKQYPDLEYEICNNFAYLPDRPDLKAVLTLGNDPITYLQNMKVLPKNRTITSLRNNAITVPGLSAPVLSSYSSGISEVDYGKYVDLLCDVNLAIRVHNTGVVQPEIGKYNYVEHFTNLLADVRAKFKANGGKRVDVALDLETIGFDPYREPAADGSHPGAYIVTIQASSQVGTGDAIYFESRAELAYRLNTDLEFVVQLHELLTSEKISLRGANLKFDLNWLYVHTGIQCTNFLFDTTLVGSILDENRSNSLNVHAKIYTTMGGYDDVFNSSVDKGRMDLIPKETLLPYACGDGDATLRVSIEQKKDLLADPALTRFYINILHPAARAMEFIEQGGVCVDLNEYNKLEGELNEEIDQLIHKAKKIMGGRIVAKHQDLSKRGGLNLTKASLLIDFMFSPMGLNLTPKMYAPKGGISSAMEHLMMFADNEDAAPFVGLLSDFSTATKTLGTYVHGFRKHIRSDGRFHPTYFLFAGNKDEGEGGTNTGRLSCKDPAFQTIPKHTKWAKRLRKVFVAPDGMLVMENDYSQGELRVIACIANEPTMIQVYRDNLDLHVITPSKFVGYTVEEIMGFKLTDPDKFSAIRQIGKSGNFGLIYGMGATGFQIFAKTSYNVNLSNHESESFRNGFFETYPALPEYHKEYKAHAKKYGFVRSPLGRVRHLPLINSKMSDIRSQEERRAINSPVQGTLSDMMIWAIAEGKEKGYHLDAPCFGLVHDAGYRYIPEDNAEFYAQREKDQMENLPFEKVGWNPQLKFVTDCKIGPSMADLKDLKLA